VYHRRQTPKWPGAALAALALVACVRANASFAEGALLIAPDPVPRGPQYWIIDSATGRKTALPRSALSQRVSHKRDDWYGGVNSRALVRVDRLDQVDVYDRQTLKRVGGFALHQLPGVRRPSFLGPAKPSPDGRYLLAYWRPDSREDERTLAVFDLEGRIVETGLPYRYDRLSFSGALDWLPDGRYIYLAGDKLVMRTPGSKTVQTAQIRLPPNVTAERAQLQVSPDGRRLLWTMTDLSRRDANVYHRFLYVSNLDGSGMRQLTTLTAKRLGALVPRLHVAASWSPSGEAVVFRVDTIGGPNEVRHMQPGCPKVFIVPSSATLAVIDDHELPPGSPAIVPRLPGRSERLLSCAASLLWLR
jgi:hypothetical protein